MDEGKSIRVILRPKEVKFLFNDYCITDFLEGRQ